MTHEAKKTLIAARQLAKELGVKSSWIYEKTRKGVLPFYKLGKYYRYDLEAVLMSLKSKKTETDSSSLAE